MTIDEIKTILREKEEELSEARKYILKLEKTLKEKDEESRKKKNIFHQSEIQKASIDSESAVQTTRKYYSSRF